MTVVDLATARATKAATRPEKVAVLIDARNVIHGAEHVLRFGEDPFHYDFQPVKFAEEIAGKRHRASEVTRVVIALGIRDAVLTPHLHRIDTLIAATWSRDPRCTVLTSPNCRYTNKEKAIDSTLGMEMVRLHGTGDVDTVVLATADRDFQPVIDHCAGTRGAHLELARWDGQPSPLRITRPNGTTGWCHYLGEDTFRRSATPARWKPAA